jgi:hypothetical protein
MIKNDFDAKEGSIHNAKQFINELQSALEVIDEMTIFNAVVNTNAIMRCLKEYPSKTKEIFELLEKQSALN